MGGGGEMGNVWSVVCEMRVWVGQGLLRVVTVVCLIGNKGLGWFLLGDGESQNSAL